MRVGVFGAVGFGVAPFGAVEYMTMEFGAPASAGECTGKKIGFTKEWSLPKKVTYRLLKKKGLETVCHVGRA